MYSKEKIIIKINGLYEQNEFETKNAENISGFE